MKEDAEKMLSNTTHIEKWEIHWVITVPAIWNDAAKQFMTEAAIKVYLIVS